MPDVLKVNGQSCDGQSAAHRIFLSFIDLVHWLERRQNVLSAKTILAEYVHFPLDSIPRYLDLPKYRTSTRLGTGRQYYEWATTRYLQLSFLLLSDATVRDKPREIIICLRETGNANMAPPLHAFAAARKILESWVMGLLVPRSRPTSVRPACSVPWFLLDAGRNATQRASTGSGCDEPTHLPREKGKASSAIVVDVVGPSYPAVTAMYFIAEFGPSSPFVKDCWEYSCGDEGTFQVHAKESRLREQRSPLHNSTLILPIELLCTDCLHRKDHYLSKKMAVSSLPWASDTTFQYPIALRSWERGNIAEMRISFLYAIAVGSYLPTLLQSKKTSDKRALKLHLLAMSPAGISVYEGHRSGIVAEECHRSVSDWQLSWVMPAVAGQPIEEVLREGLQTDWPSSRKSFSPHRGRTESVRAGCGVGTLRDDVNPAHTHTPGPQLPIWLFFYFLFESWCVDCPHTKARIRTTRHIDCLAIRAVNHWMFGMASRPSTGCGVQDPFGMRKYEPLHSLFSGDTYTLADVPWDALYGYRHAFQCYWHCQAIMVLAACIPSGLGSYGTVFHVVHDWVPEAPSTESAMFVSSQSQEVVFCCPSA
ncbi:hypothetical protein EV401DRAFT_2201807 [Pisolithus croceorrhizus]|nr:hypothetical protein EV401DRAFT_2201807 [Pisolithus croceorrhizus]